MQKGAPRSSKGEDSTKATTMLRGRKRYTTSQHGRTEPRKGHSTEVLTTAERMIEEEGEEVEGLATTVEGDAGAPANSFVGEVAVKTPASSLLTRRRRHRLNEILGEASSTEQEGRDLES